MSKKGYNKAERVEISEAEFVSGGSMGNGERIKTTIYDFDVKSESKVTCAKPENLNTQSMIDIQVGSGRYSSIKRVLYDLTKPYGQDNRKTAYFYGNRSPEGKYVGQAASFINRLIKTILIGIK